MAMKVGEDYWIADFGEDLCEICLRGDNDSVYSKCLATTLHRESTAVDDETPRKPKTICQKKDENLGTLLFVPRRYTKN